MKPNVNHMFLYNDALYGYRINRDAQKYQISRLDLILEEWSHSHSIGEGPPTNTSFEGVLYLEKLERLVTLGDRLNLLAMPECQWVKSVTKGTPPNSFNKKTSCVLQGKIYCGADKEYFELFVLEVETNNHATWSKILVPSTITMTIKSRAFVSFSGKLLISGGLDFGTRTTEHHFTVFDPKTQNFQKTKILDLTLSLFAASFTIEEGQSFGVFEFSEGLDGFAR